MLAFCFFKALYEDMNGFSLSTHDFDSKCSGTISTALNAQRRSLKPAQIRASGLFNTDIYFI